MFGVYSMYVKNPTSSPNCTYLALVLDEKFTHHVIITVASEHHLPGGSPRTVFPKYLIELLWKRAPVDVTRHGPHVHPPNPKTLNSFKAEAQQIRPQM